jgi:hypothetical protein
MEYSDYVANPGKYKLYKTARLAVDLPGTDYKKGQYVSVRHFDDRPNAVFIGSPVYPVYAVNEDVYLFGNALENFVL